MPGTIYICPTPIGNLGDITLRTLDALRDADVVCAEDTRVTGRLLAHFGIEKRVERLDEAVIAQRAPRIVERVEAGETIAFCSDAGMPGVSDPGARLIAEAQARGVPCVVLPGASAAATAYVASGIAAPCYYFGGFFPRKQGERRDALKALAALDAALVFYESPHRVVAALEAVAHVFPERDVAVCRELTKLHEEVFKGPAQDVLREFSEREAHGAIRGEIALVVGPPTPDEADRDQEELRHAAVDRARELLSDPSVSKKDIVRMLKSEFGMGRNEAYELVHAL